MEVVVQPATEVLATLAAEAIEGLARTKPDLVIGLATGSSPLAVYGELVRGHRTGQVRFDQARAFTLDEYVGLPDDHPERYRNVISRDFVAHVDFAPGAVQGSDGNAAEGPVSAMWPATILQHYPHATVLLDEAAASQLQLAAYYRQGYDAKPSWQ